MILLTLNVSVLLTSQFHEAMRGSLTNIPTWWVLPYWTVNMAHTAHTLCKNKIIGECDVTISAIIPNMILIALQRHCMY